MTQPVPADFTLRSPVAADLQPIVSLLNADSVEHTGRRAWQEEELRRNLSAPGFNVVEDARAVLNASGTLVAFFGLWDNEPHVRLEAWGSVHPAHRGRGIGTALCQWIEQRARQSVPKAPAGARVVLVQTVSSVNQAAQDLLSRRGFQLVRHELRMAMELHGPIPEPAVPEGTVIRPLAGKDELPAFVEAIRDEMRDHWGYVELPFEQDLKLWTHWVDSDPEFDPSLWLVAVANSQIVGTVVCLTRTAEGPGVGYIGELGVRRPWRHRGVATALLQRSFRELMRRGKNTAALDVDALSLTGATRLYEKAGMHVERESVVFELELCPGFDLSLAQPTQADSTLAAHPDSDAASGRQPPA
jgi:mycothiol synthase